MDLFQVRFNGMVRMCDVIFKDTKIHQHQGIEVRITEREKNNQLPLSNSYWETDFKRGLKSHVIIKSKNSFNQASRVVFTLVTVQHRP